MKYYLSLNSMMDDEEIDGSLDEAMAKADEMACYTQQNIRIYADDKRDTLVAERRWYGVEPDDEVSEGDIISFGKFGYYDEWYVID